MMIDMQTSRLWMQVVLPIVGGVMRLVLPKAYDDRAMDIALTVAGVEMVLSAVMWFMFDNAYAGYQMSSSFKWIDAYNIEVSFGVDGVSLFFVVLTSFRTPRCRLSSGVNISRAKLQYYGRFIILEGLVQGVFRATDRLVFYIMFEAVLIPMYRIISLWGSRERKVRAAYFFFRYTLIGSLMMRVGILYRYNRTGTMDIALLSSYKLSRTEEYLVWFVFFLALAVKVPMMPFHIWLPEAHVEAPTGGSVMLAGVLLKMGTYGMVRLLLGLFPTATVYFTPLVYTLCIIGMLYTSITAIRQTDMKRIIAYASVAHRNMTVVGVFTNTVQGLEGALLQMFSHGLVAGALFMCVGVRYDRHHSRLVTYYGGVAQTMPRFVFMFRFFTMANIALPGTSSFVGEFRIRVGAFQVNTYVAVMSTVGMVLGGAYSLWLYNRVAYGNIKTGYVGLSSDMNTREFLMMTPLVVMTMIIGVYPDVFLDSMHYSCSNVIEYGIVNS